MKISPIRISALVAVALVIAACGQQDDASGAYPCDTITFIVPFAAGGGTDNYVRQLAVPASAELGVPIRIENVPGVGGLIGMRQLSEAAADGCTIGSYNPPATSIAQMAEGENAPLDLRELTNIGSYGFGGWVMFAHVDLPADDLAGVIELYRSGQITALGAESVGGPTQLIAELMRANDGLAYQTYVGYAGGGEVAPAVLRKEVPVGIASDSAALSAIESGQAKVIATLFDPRSPFYPDTLTAVEQGYSDISFVSRITRLLVAPQGLSDDLSARLASAFEAATLASSVQEWSAATGSPVLWEDASAADEAALKAFTIEDEIPNLQEILGN